MHQQAALKLGLLSRLTGQTQVVDDLWHRQQSSYHSSSLSCVLTSQLPARETPASAGLRSLILWRSTGQPLAFRRQHSGPPGQQPSRGKLQSQDWAQAGWTWNEVCNLPNSLSLARLASGPFISALIMNHNWSTAFVAISVAAITDWLDGAAAKRFHTNSVLGSYLDPLADKVLVCCVVGALGYEGSLPVWLASLIIGRDVLLIGGTIYARLSSLNFKWPGWAEFFSVAAGIPGNQPQPQQTPPHSSMSGTGFGLSDSPAAAAAATTSASTPTATEGQSPMGSSLQQVPLLPPHKEASVASAKAAEFPAEAPGHDPAPSAPLIKPLFISKVNTCVQLALVVGCLSRSWYEWPPDDVVFLLGATTALTTLGSGAAYLLAFRRGSGTFTAMPGIGPQKP
ncbi:hypothetical protein WJX74_011018 [Apatococcus lobatus]|uniref:Cardiolipin synthase n=1 Tax=Apatococcus lobatus TaxID=904363 RepID=A0AAW1RT79_9CHLO